MDEPFTENHKPDTGPDARRPRPTNENPNFVREYFAASRLHFIGSFRARFESMMGEVARRLNVHPSALLLPPASARPARAGVERVIVHIDMDCFFASVAVAGNPSLRGRPIAVCHAHVAADGTRRLGSGEISSCSYEARGHGVRAGMFFAKAKELCPMLIGVPYDFGAYERVSIAIYARFFSIPAAIVEACSVDEAYLDITDVSGIDPEQLVSDLRAQIYADNQCRASAGIGPSRLVARLATKVAKPDGQLRIRAAEAAEFVAGLSIKELPGVGWRTSRRLSEMGIDSAAQLLTVSLARLRAEFGEKAGRGFYEAVRGIDERPVQPMGPRKSIGAEASWGVRFNASPGDREKCVKFVNDMAAEVASRVIAAGALGTKVHYKGYRLRDPDGPHKYLGHGPCNILTKSAKLAGKVTAENLAVLMAEVCQRIHAELKIPNNELRGVGIQLTDLTFENLGLDGKHSVGGGATSRIDAFLKRSSDRNPFSHKSLKRNLLEYDALHAKRARVGSKEQKGKGGDKKSRLSDREPAGSRSGAEPDAEAGKEEQNNGHVEEPESQKEGKISMQNAVASDSVRDCDQKANSPGTVEIPGDWDAAVFAALPANIRDELLANELQNNASNNESSSHRAEADGDDSGGTPRRLRLERRLAGMAKPPVRGGRGGKSGREAGRKRGPVQVTMTQFAQISKLKNRGHAILNASQFENKSFGECVEIAADLDAVKEKQAAFPSDLHSGRTSHADEKKLTPRTPHGMVIPPPPTLSSDSESEQDGGKDMATMIKENVSADGRVFEEESVADIANDLQLWMAHVQGDLRSAHVELVRSRFFELVRLHKLARLCSEIRTIRVFAEDMGDSGWVTVIKRLVEETQQECRKLHGFTLKLEM